MNKKNLIISAMCIFLHSSYLFSYRLSREERASLDYKDDDTFMEFITKNQDYHRKRVLAAQGIEVTEENKAETLKLADKIIEENTIKKEESISKKNLSKLVFDQKYPILVGSLVLGTYGYLISKLYKSKKYINRTITWSCFKKNVPIEALYEIPEDKFLHDLIVVIYRTFSEDDHNPNYDDIEPFYLFIKTAHKEIKRLESFINLYWYVKLPVISLIFPNLDDELILAQEKIEKLSYMQELVTNKICAMNS